MAPNREIVRSMNMSQNHCKSELAELRLSNQSPCWASFSTNRKYTNIKWEIFHDAKIILWSFQTAMKNSFYNYFDLLINQMNRMLIPQITPQNYFLKVCFFLIIDSQSQFHKLYFKIKIDLWFLRSFIILSARLTQLTLILELSICRRHENAYKAKLERINLIFTDFTSAFFIFP